MSNYEYKGMTYTIETRRVGHRWGWTVTVGDLVADSGTASIEPEAAAFAEAKAKAERIIDEPQRNIS